MSEHETLSTLLRTSTEHLDADVSSLVAGATVRGRRRARRRTALEAAGLGVGALALGAGAWAIAPGASSPATEPGLATQPTASDPGEPTLGEPSPAEDFTPSSGTMPTQVDSDRTPVASDDLPGAFTAAAPGDVVVLRQDADTPGQRWIQFTWNGFSTTIHIRAATTDDPADTWERCLAEDPATTDECSRLNVGTVVRRLEYTGAGTQLNRATAYGTDGWDVTVIMTNDGATKGRAIADAPAMGADQLLEIALTGEWFAR